MNRHWYISLIFLFYFLIRKEIMNTIDLSMLMGCCSWADLSCYVKIMNLENYNSEEVHYVTKKKIISN